MVYRYMYLNVGQILCPKIKGYNMTELLIKLDIKAGRINYNRIIFSILLF